MKSQKLFSYLFAVGGFGLGLAHAQASDRGAAGHHAPADALDRPAALPENRGVTPVASGDQVRKEDRDFLTKSLRTGEDLVDLADIASSRAVFPQVREFAEEIASAYTKANKELEAIILQKGLRIGSRDTIAAREQTKKWNEKSGNEFDEDYLEAMIDLQEDLIGLMDDVDDSEADVAAYSRRHLPTIKAYVERAKAILKAID